MFAYCNNDPVIFCDSCGTRIEAASEKDFVGAMGGSICIPFMGLISFLADIFTPTKAISREKSDSTERADVLAISSETREPIIFPLDPNAFLPIGLVRADRPGTKNGAIISWMDPATNIEVFRWDENPNYSNGPHYHILRAGHYVPGVSIVPEPFASIYFPYR